MDLRQWQEFGTMVPWGIDRITGRERLVQEVPRGKNCGCDCPGCGEPLQSRQGDRVVWHFAHLPGASGRDSQGRSCGESALHKMAVRVVADLAEFREGKSVPRATGLRSVKAGRLNLGMGSGVDTRMRQSWVERKSVLTTRQPDVTAVVFHRGGNGQQWRYDLGEMTVALEIAVTHNKGLDYIEEMTAAGLLAYELDIDLNEVYDRMSRMQGVSELSKALRVIAQQVPWRLLTPDLATVVAYSNEFEFLGYGRSGNERWQVSRTPPRPSGAGVLVANWSRPISVDDRIRREWEQRRRVVGGR